MDTKQLTPRSHGFHLVTGELLRELPELRNFKVGMANIFIMHTSASLTISENADPTVIYRMMRRLFSKKAEAIRQAGVWARGQKPDAGIFFALGRAALIRHPRKSRDPVPLLLSEYPEND